MMTVEKMTASAALFHGPGQPLETREFPLPTLEPGELLVRVSCSTICGSDVHSYCGDRSTPVPTILGHEILGTIAQLPPDAHCLDHTGLSLEIGDRVTWTIAASCGECFYCEHGLPQKCASLFKYGHQPINDSHPLSGGLAEYCHLAAGTAIFHVPDDLPDAVACPANCATATVAAALRYAGDCTDRTVLIQGAGMLGLTAAALARYREAATVIVCDVNQQRLEQARRFGADHIALPNELPEVVAATTAGRGVDVALELSGAATAMEQGLDLLRVGGRYIWVGAVSPTEAVPLLPEKIVRNLLTIQGVHNYTPTDLEVALDFLMDCHQQFPFAELVGEEFGLHEAEAAMQAAKQSDAPRVMVRA